MINKIYYIFVFLVAVFTKGFAQNHHEDLPTSFNYPEELINWQNLPTKNVKQISKADFKIEQESILLTDTMLITGKNFEEKISWENDWTTEYLNDSSVIRRIKFNFSECDNVGFFIDSCNIPENAMIYAFNPNNLSKVLLFTKKNLSLRTSGFILGIETAGIIILEYYQKKELKMESGYLHIFATSQEFEDQNTDYLSYKMGDADLCHVNANCPQAFQWCNQKRASVRIILREPPITSPQSNSYSCSATFLNNEKSDGRPYVITAGHCADFNDDKHFSTSEISASQYYSVEINWQGNDCNTPIISPTPKQVINGANWISGNMNMDFALVELSMPPNNKSDGYFSGWDNSFNSGDYGVIFSHPKSDIKKFTRWENVNDLGGYFNTYEVKEGGVQSGSSGAGVFNAAGKLVGVHSSSSTNANDACDKNANRYFGRFEEIWDDGSNNSLRVREWLNPNGDHEGSSQYYIESMSGMTTCKDNWSFTNADDLHTSANISFTNYQNIGTRMYNGVYYAKNKITAQSSVTIKSGTNVVFNAGQEISLGPGFTIQSGASFTSIIEGCISSCSGVNKTDINTNENEEKMVISTIPRTKKYINNYDSLHIQIYPNPAQDILQVNIDAATCDLVTIKISDITCRVLLEKENVSQKQISFDITDLASGIYYLTLICNERAYSRIISKI